MTDENAQAEAGRVVAEAGRVVSENERAKAEGVIARGRIQAEDRRETAEDARVVAENQRVITSDEVASRLRVILEGFKQEETARQAAATAKTRRRFWGAVVVFFLACGALGGYAVQQKDVLDRFRKQDQVACAQRSDLSNATKQAFLAEYDLIGRPIKPPRSATDQAVVDAFVKDSKALVELSFPSIDCSHAGGH